MYVLDMVGTIILVKKEMYRNKKKFLGRERFQWSGGDANHLFLFGLTPSKVAKYPI